MKIIKLDEGTAHEAIKVTDIEGDMGEAERLQLLQQPDGDVIITLYNPSGGTIGSLEFCSSSGGGRRPEIAKKLRELIRYLVEGEAPRYWPLKSPECTAENPCCDRRGEYNGFGSGPLKFTCPKHCPCHD